MSGINPPSCCTLTLIAICRDTKTEANDTMNLDTAQFCYIGSGIGWVSTLLYYYHIISHETNYSYILARQEKRFCFLIIIR